MNLTDIAKTALLKAKEAHDSLGEAGLEKTQRNSFGDLTLRCDWECEEAVLKTLREAGVPVRVISEEHGELDLHPKPEFLAVLDGLDGTSGKEGYKNARGTGKYATMFGIFNGLDPKYRDFEFNGSIDLPTGVVYWTTGGNSFADQNKIACSGVRNLAAARVRFDPGSYEVQGAKAPNLGDLPWEELGSSAAHYIDLARGETDLVIESTRKKNLEIAASVGLITMAGGVMRTLDGKSIVDKEYLKFGQGKESITVISAATPDLAEEAREYLLRHNPELK